MKKFIFKDFVYIITAVTLMQCISQLNYAQTKDGWKNLKYSIFFTSGDVKNLLADEAVVNKTFEHFAPIKIEKVYLEGKNRGEEDVELMKTVADRFRARGILAAGAMVPTSDKGGPCCYNDPDDMATLENRMRAQASIFDDIILDDW